MDVTIYQSIYVKDKMHTSRLVYKEIETDFVPRKGDFYEDSAFKDPYEFEVNRVHINYQQGYCAVYINPEILVSGDEENVIEYVKMMMLHGWKCNIL